MGKRPYVLYTDAFVTVSLATSVSGTASLSLPIPNLAALTGIKLYFQWANLDVGANQLNLTSSNYGRALLGN